MVQSGLVSRLFALVAVSADTIGGSRTLLPSADGSGSYYFVAQIHNLLHPHFRETLRDELMHGLYGLSNVGSQQTYFSKMSLHSVLASRVAADRYAAEFNKLSAAWFTGWYDAYGNHRSPTITERDEIAATGEVLVVTTTMPVQPLSVPLYQILNTTATALSVDYIQSGNVYARSSLENRLELDLNVYGAVLERMTVMVILGDRNVSEIHRAYFAWSLDASHDAEKFSSSFTACHLARSSSFLCSRSIRRKIFTIL